MKFSQKIFLISFILIIIVINIIGIVMINYTYKLNIEKEIEKSISQTNNIMHELTVYSSYDLSTVANNYLKNGINVDVYINGQRSYTNFKSEDSQIAEGLLTSEDKSKDEGLTTEIDNIENGLLDTDEDKIKAEKNSANIVENSSYIEYMDSYIINDKLFMKLKRDNYIVITLSSISEANNMKQEQTNFFIELSVISSFIIALFLSITVNFLTRKIKKLDKAVNKVKQGNYNIKLKRLGNDEIGNFGNSFNEMTIAIQDNINKIQEVSENRRQFIGDLTHEIRTPLTSIIGYSSLINNDKVTDNNTIKQYSARIYEEGKYIQQMSERLTEMLLIENGSIKKELINISEEMKIIIEELENLYYNAIFNIQIEENVYKEVDKILLKSLIYNLVKNAIGAYDTTPRIDIYLSKYEITIIDYGRGIPEDKIEKIKEPFYTLTKDRNRKISGMGLGLTLCFKIVNIHNWKLNIKSEIEKGTKVTILI